MSCVVPVGGKNTRRPRATSRREEARTSMRSSRASDLKVILAPLAERQLAALPAPAVERAVKALRILQAAPLSGPAYPDDSPLRGARQGRGRASTSLDLSHHLHDPEQRARGSFLAPVLVSADPPRISRAHRLRAATRTHAVIRQTDRSRLAYSTMWRTARPASWAARKPLSAPPLRTRSGCESASG